MLSFWFLITQFVFQDFKKVQDRSLSASNWSTCVWHCKQLVSNTLCKQRKSMLHSVWRIRLWKIWSFISWLISCLVIGLWIIKSSHEETISGKISTKELFSPPFFFTSLFVSCLFKFITSDMSWCVTSCDLWVNQSRILS